MICCVHQIFKVHPRTGHEGFDLYLISALDRVGGQRHAPAALFPGRTRYLLGGPQARSGRVREVSPPTGTRSPNLQPVASCYTA